MFSLIVFTVLVCEITNGITKEAFAFEEEDISTEDLAEHKLIADLLRGYNKFAHPKSYFKESSNFTVVFGIEIVQLVAVEDRNQRIITNCWVRQQWNNPALRWNPSNYKNITKIRLSGDKIWIPDVVLYNSADTQQASGGLLKYHTQIIIDHRGHHFWYAPTSFISTCKINVRYFPFDRQRCIMKFGSWTFQIDDLDIVSDSRPVVTSQYLKSAEWDFINVRVDRHITTYGCCKFPFSDITIELVISRRPLFYIFNLMIPCFIIIAMVLMGFFLPPESGERTTLSITVLLAMAVFLQLQAEHLPRNSEEIPLLGIFYIAVMAQVGLSLMATCYVLNIHHKNSGVHIVPMHPFVSKFFLGTMASMLRISPPTVDSDLTKPDVERPRPTVANQKAESDTKVNKLDETSERVGVSDALRHGPTGFLQSSRGGRHRCSISKPSLVHSVSCSAIGCECPGPHSKSLENYCSILADNVKRKHAIRLNQEKWKYLAMVLDRIFFLVFIITIFTSTVLIYYQVNAEL